MTYTCQQFRDGWIVKSDDPNAYTTFWGDNAQHRARNYAEYMNHVETMSFELRKLGVQFSAGRGTYPYNSALNWRADLAHAGERYEPTAGHSSPYGMTKGV